MRRTLIIAFLVAMFSSHLRIGMPEAYGQNPFPEVGVCYPYAIFHSLGYEVVGKIDAHHYELYGDPWPTLSSHAALETKKTVFKSNGPLVIAMMKYVGNKTVQLENGFDGRMELWKECTCSDGKSYPTQYCP